jgi:membrane AbrB-like protein
VTRRRHPQPSRKKGYPVGQIAAPLTLRRYGLTALVALVSGALAWGAGLPVPWLLGALSGTAACSLGGVRLGVPLPLKTATHAMIGLILGASVGPETFARAAQWPVSLAVLSLGMVLVTSVTAIYYIRIAGYDRLTATAASLTGGLTNIVAVAIQLGAHPPATVIGQLFRLTAVVIILPLVYTGWLGAADDLPQMSDGDALTGGNLWLLPLALPAYLIARHLRFPVADMIGPMILSAGFGFIGYGLELPVWLLAGVFVLVGASIGTRFYGLQPASLIRIGGHGAVATAILLVCSALLALPFSLAADVPYYVALLAVAPGGVAEIAILATILGVDPVFVTFHQVFRNIVLNALAPFLLSRLREADI